MEKIDFVNIRKSIVLVLKNARLQYENYSYREMTAYRISRLEDSYRDYLRKTQIGKAHYFPEVIEFYSRLINKLKVDFEKHQKITTIESKVIEKTHAHWHSLSNIGFISFDHIARQDEERRTSLMITLNKNSFELIDGVGYVKTEHPIPACIEA